MTETARYGLRWFGERAAAAGAIITFLAMITGFIWPFINDRVLAWLHGASGVPELAAQIDSTAKMTNESLAQTNASILRLSEQVEANRELIQSFHPFQVAEYDMFLSRIYSPCARGGDCEVQYRARRTAFGLPCERPETVGRVVTDRWGIEHRVEQPRTNAQRIEDDWTMITVIFTVPERVPIGVASFHMVLSYMCPQGDGTREVVQDTPKLVFEVTDG